MTSLLTNWKTTAGGAATMLLGVLSLLGVHLVGSATIDPQTARVMRIEMQAYGFPAEFPTDDVESATDYEYVRLGDAKQYLLPVHAETLSCQRGTAMCSRNTIDFRNYRRYTGESTITFGDGKQ